MSFHPDFRLGIAISLVLILVGAYSYFYSTQVTYSYQTPVIEYMPQQRIQSVSVYDLDISEPVSGGGIIYFGPYNAVATAFDEMDFNLADTGWSTWLSIEGLRNGVVFDNISTRHCSQRISVWSNDTYTIKIRNLNPNQPASMYGSIHISRTYVTTEMTPYTIYQTEYASYTDYPNRLSGAIFIVLGTLAGFGTGISILLHRRRMKEIL